MRKKFFLIIIILLLLCGCGRKKMHSKQELLDYIDNYYCEYTEKESCNLKGNYTVIDEKTYKDDKQNKDARELILKPNKYDFEFSVKSIYTCTGKFSASCYEWGYSITTDYDKEARKYFANQYSKNLTDSCEFSDSGYLTCTVVNKGNLDSVVSSINGYISYLNKQDIKFDIYRIYLELQYKDNSYYYKDKTPYKSEEIHTYIDDDTYYLYKPNDDNTKKIKITDLKEHILDLYDENEIKIEE